MDKNPFDGLALLHDLVPFLPVDRLHAILHNTPLPDEADGVALFADISGFTPLAEQLSRELGPERGAEELNTQVNYTFVGLIDAVDRYHGSVLRFSGDALLAWFTGRESTQRAVTAAQAMRAFMQAVNPVLPWLQLKIGIGTGWTKRFNPGDPTQGIYDVLAGEAIIQMARAEQLAQPGQIIISPEVGQGIEGLFQTEIISDDGYLRVKPTIFVPESDIPSRWTSIRWMEYLDRAWDLVTQFRPYLPAPIFDRIKSGSGGYMTELRMVTPLFIHFSGIDYATQDAASQLNEMVRVAQGIIGEHDGYLNEVGVDDKGSFLVVLFGAPTSMENPPQRAAYTALELMQRLPYIKNLHLGLTVGRLFTGTVGSPMRRAYAVIGDEVNLAARLMGRAQPGELLANHTAVDLARDFAWEALPPMRVKGKTAPVRVYKMLGLADITRPIFPMGHFVARIKELAELNWALDTGNSQRSHTLLMIGDPGLGKSHLLGKFEDMLKERGITGLVGIGRNIERQTPYRAWRDVFQQYFEINMYPSLEEQRQHILTRMNQINPELAPRAPLLNDILHVDFPENRFTESLEPAERHSALVNMLTTLLLAWLEEDALAITLDNAQWLDALSWDLVYEIAQQIPDRQLTLLLSMRPFKDDAPRPYRLLAALENTRQLILKPLDPANAKTLIAEQLGIHNVPQNVADLVLEKTGGNPFFIKEVTNVLLDNGILVVAADQVVLKGNPDAFKLPDTVQSTVRSRIDRMTPEQQTLLKVAAVIGPQFTRRALKAIQPLRLSEQALQTCLNALDSIDVRRVDTQGPDEVYEFQYAITRDVAYNALSFSQRRQLHRAVAQWSEQEYQQNLAPYYGILTHHWNLAEDHDKERHYSYLAGVRAAAQYANDNAIAYLVRALELMPTTDTEQLYDTLARLEDLYHLKAARDEQQTILSTISVLAEDQNDDDMLARAHYLWARLYESMSQYAACIESAEKAIVAAGRTHNLEFIALSSVIKGLALMHMGSYREAQLVLAEIYIPEDDRIEAWRQDVLGATLARMGDYNVALEVYKSAQTKGNAAGDRAAVGTTLNNMGDAYMGLGDYEQASRHYWRALTIRRAIGDRQGEAVTLSRLGELSLETGDYEQALEYLEETRGIFQLIDDPAGEAAALHNIGKVQSDRRDFLAALGSFNRASDIRQQIGDQRGIALSLLDLALVETELGDLDSAEYHLKHAMRVSEELPPATRRRFDIMLDALTSRVALRRGNKRLALHYIEEVYQAVEKEDLNELPSLITACTLGFEVTIANDRMEECRYFLEKAYQQLIKRAERINDPEKRTRYLLKVPSHRELMILYERHMKS